MKLNSYKLNSVCRGESEKPFSCRSGWFPFIFKVHLTCKMVDNGQDLPVQNYRFCIHYAFIAPHPCGLLTPLPAFHFPVLLTFLLIPNITTS